MRWRSSAGVTVGVIASGRALRHPVARAAAL